LTAFSSSSVDGGEQERQQQDQEPNDDGEDGGGVEKKLTVFQASSVLANYISVGYILLPGGFALGGTVMTPIILAIVVLQAYACGIFVLESCARAEALENLQILQTISRHGQRGLPRRYSFRVRDRKFELSELSRVFLGRGWRNFFTVTTCCDLYGLTWALASVFGSALSNAFPLFSVGSANGDDDEGYMVYVVTFMAITATLSCLGINDQIWLQMTFLSLRLVMVTLMVATAAIAYTSSTPQFGSQIGPINDIPLFNFRETIGTSVICVFSTAYQFSVPTLTNETNDKTKMIPIIRRSISFVYASNLVLSLVLCIFFGLSINESSNLSWVDYHGGTWDGEGDIAESRALWASFISQYIVLFAAIDGLAVYPLCCISLGEIMMGTIFEETVHEVEQSNWKIRTAFRLLASVPQAAGALFVRDLGAIAKFAGCFTLLSYTVCPCLLNIYSTKRLDTENEGAYSLNRQGSETYYRSTCSSNGWSWALIIVSLCLIIGVIVEASLPGGSL
jgi:hypothetical protein